MSKQKKYNDSTGLLVESEGELWVNPATGEERYLQSVEKRYYGQKNFWKMYLQDFLAVLGILESKQVDVICYVLAHTDSRTNLFIGTMDKISQESGVSRSTVVRAMSRLKSANFISQTDTPSVYMVNPDVMVQGSEYKKRGLLITYTEDRNGALPEDGGVPIIEAANLVGE